ncbi:GntR family transcriptional regulator [Sulfitobacter sp. TSTF-M16]|uniref:GntR family transcriptional regulator n=2 Tax=Sulfitobacter aestuariivivens TaxID=2766981 RepID=A0A927HHU0_9RHOB|nr:GntR family transcriptional regulator [Sulfitobacter aestuariivivens]MBD3665590.1 GntR family transcriptional regulator [Sulfitobacter aestuariivivens]
MDEAAQTLGNSAFKRMKAMILDGTLEPGTLLREKKFADRLGVSRTPVREAIGQLISEGLATRSEGGAPVVSRVSLSDIMEILHVRSLLECEAAKKAALSGKSMELLLEYRAQIVGFLEGPRPEAEVHSALDSHLHLEIARLAGSKLLIEIIDGLKVKTRMFDQGSIPDRFIPGCHEHLVLIDAIVAQSADDAAAAMKTHLLNVRKAIISHIHHPF